MLPSGHNVPHSRIVGLTDSLRALAVGALLQVLLRESEVSATRTKLAKAQQELAESEAQHRCGLTLRQSLDTEY
jgi:hypothetical protein